MTEQFQRVEFTLDGISCRTIATSDQSKIRVYRDRLQERDDVDAVNVVTLPDDIQE